MRSVVALGGFAWDVALRLVRATGGSVPRPAPRFGHGGRGARWATRRAARCVLLGCYHPSQQNTFTGRLTMPMLTEVLVRAADHQA